MDARLLLELRDDVGVKVVAPAVDVERVLALRLFFGKAVTARREKRRHKAQEQQENR